jgi:hypothetical protein
MQSLITPIRHIVRIEDSVPYFNDEFQAWYYDKYRKLEGDEFAYCLSTKAMKEKEAEIIKEYDEAMSKEERRKNWKEYCENNAKKGEKHNERKEN